MQQDPLEFWTFVAEQGRWQRRWRDHAVRVTGPQDTSACWPASAGADPACECCVLDQAHSRAYHLLRAGRSGAAPDGAEGGGPAAVRATVARWLGLSAPRDA